MRYYQNYAIFSSLAGASRCIPLVLIACVTVPKCEIFYIFDFTDFYVRKSLYLGDFRDEIIFFFNEDQIRNISSMLAYV
jgi:hypothetical protein